MWSNIAYKEEGAIYKQQPTTYRLIGRACKKPKDQWISGEVLDFVEKRRNIAKQHIPTLQTGNNSIGSLKNQKETETRQKQLDGTTMQRS